MREIRVGEARKGETDRKKETSEEVKEVMGIWKGRCNEIKMVGKETKYERYKEERNKE